MVLVGVGRGEAGAADGAGLAGAGFGEGDGALVGSGLFVGVVSAVVSPVGASVPGALLPAVKTCLPP